MLASYQSKVRNRLLALMTPQDFALLAPDLEAVDLPRGMVLVEAGRTINRVYFPDAGVGSVVATSPEGGKAEVGLFGLDGLCPIAAVMGVNQIAKQEFMQVAGKGHAISLEAFSLALNASLMASDIQLREGYALLLRDCPDETIERVTGLGLLEILALRAGEGARINNTPFTTPECGDIAGPC